MPEKLMLPLASQGHLSLRRTNIRSLAVETNTCSYSSRPNPSNIKKNRPITYYSLDDGVFVRHLLEARSEGDNKGHNVKAQKFRFRETATCTPLLSVTFIV